MAKNLDGENPSDESAKEETLTARVKDEGFWKEMWHQMRLVWQLIRSPEVPLYLKILPALAFIYILIPTDFIPDFIPGLGQLDDLTALIVGAKVFIELAPQDVVARQLRTLRSQQEIAAVDPGSNGSTENVENISNSIIIEGDFETVEGENENQAS
jgi:uncharacterized membrane protein YkvA (DUF1232 family)